MRDAIDWLDRLVVTIVDQWQHQSIRSLTPVPVPAVSRMRGHIRTAHHDNGGDDKPKGPDESTDDLGPARGIVWSVVLGVAAWLLLIGILIFLL